MRILVTGGSGLLGKTINKKGIAQGFEMISGSRDECKGDVRLDYLDGALLLRQIKALGPLNAVVNLASIGSALQCKPQDDSATENPYSKTACEANVVLATNVALTCERLGIPLIHASSAYVFQGVDPDGNARKHPYSPFDEPDARTPYGMSKRASEWCVQRVMRHTPYLTLRLPWLYGEGGGIMQQVSAPNLTGIRINCEQRCNPVYTGDAADWILQRIVNGLNNYPGNTEHLGGPVELTRYDLANIMLEKMGRGERPTPVTNLDEDPLRPPYITLSRPRIDPHIFRQPDEVLSEIITPEGPPFRREMMR